MIDENFGKGAADLPEHFLTNKAWRHEEISAAFPPAVWTEKDPNTGFVTYPKRNQGLQSTCVLYSLAKALSVDEYQENGQWREFSPRSVYPYVFAPGGGSNSVVAAKYVAGKGMTLEALLPTDGLTEADAEKDTNYVTDAKLVALIYKPSFYVEAATDFETIASILQYHQQQGIKKVVNITVIGFNNGTWTTPFPTPPSSATQPGLWYHRVTVTDFGLINGKKVLAIDNSWGENIGNKGQQFLTQDYEPFMYGAIYTVNIADNYQQLSVPTVQPPKYTWNTDLATGSTGPDVVALQTALQSMGMFPISSIIKPTGTYGGITKNAVILFQSAFGIPPTGTVGPITRAKLNSLFS